MRLLVVFVIIGISLSCKKDCLKKGDCEISTYESAFLVEQTLPASTGTIYYIDGDKGRKGNNGTSEDDAFKEIKNLEDITFSPGDQILFKRGQIHYGEMLLNQGGSEANRIYIGDYGEGNLPVVKSRDGAKGEAVTFHLNQANYVSFYNLNIQGGIHSILLSNSSNVEIAGCRIGEKADAGIHATAEYSEGDGSNYGEVRNCLFNSNIFGDVGDGQSTDAIKLMDGASNWHIHHNEFKAWAHSAISIKQIYNLKENNNNLIEYNTFNCADIDYMRAFDVAGGEGKASNNIIQFNTVNDQSVNSHIHGDNNICAFNMFLGLTGSSASEQPFAIDLHVFRGNLGGAERDNYVCHDIKIHHNLVANYTSGAGIKVYRSSDGTNYNVVNCEIANNIFFNCGSAIEVDNESTNLSIQNNLVFNESSGASLEFDEQVYELATFEALDGTRGFIIQNNVEGNPLFINAATSNFGLQTSSAAIDAGLELGYTIDFNGTMISGTPDIGPIQY